MISGFCLYERGSNLGSQCMEDITSIVFSFLRIYEVKVSVILFRKWMSSLFVLCYLNETFVNEREYLLQRGIFLSIWRTKKGHSFTQPLLSFTLKSTRQIRNVLKKCLPFLKKKFDWIEIYPGACAYG